MGDLVISILLEKLDHKPASLDLSTAPVIVTVFNEELLLDSYHLAAELRTGGLKVAVYPTIEKLGKQFKYADRIGAKIGVVIGPEELESHQVMVKNLSSGIQKSVSRNLVVDMISAMLAPVNSP
jgi:histidyl-tRNA synthetase